MTKQTPTCINRNETAQFAALIRLKQTGAIATPADIATITRTIRQDFSPWQTLSSITTGTLVVAQFGTYDTLDARVEPTTNGYNFFDTASEFADSGIYVVEYEITETTGDIHKLTFQVTAR